VLFAKSYKQALAAPTAKGGRGWAHADAASMQAALCQALGIKWCINPEAIWKWANRHNISLWEHRKRLTFVNDLLLVAVLNDWTLDHTERELKG
jgi:hypothetical protein